MKKIISTFLLSSAVCMNVSMAKADWEPGTLRLGGYTGFGHLHGDLISGSNTPVTPIIFVNGTDVSAERSSKPLVGMVFGFDKFISDQFFVGGELDLGFTFYKIDDAFTNVVAENEFLSELKHQGSLTSSVILGYRFSEHWDVRAKLGLSVHVVTAKAINITDNIERSKQEFNIGIVPGVELVYHCDGSKAITLSASYDLQRNLPSTLLDTVQGGNATYNNTLQLNSNIFNVKIGFLIKI